MNVTSFYTVDYENKRLADAVKTNPIQTQYKANTNPIPEMSKMNVTSILTKDYENKPPSSPKKTNPIQTQSNPISKGIPYCSAERLAMIENSLFVLPAHTPDKDFHRNVCLDAFLMSMSFLTIYKVIYPYVTFEFTDTREHIGKALKNGRVDLLMTQHIQKDTTIYCIF